MKKPTEIIAFRCDKIIKEQINKDCVSLGISMSTYIRLIVMRNLKEPLVLTKGRAG